MGFLNVCITILNILCKGGLWGKLEQAILFLFRNDNSPGKQIVYRFIGVWLLSQYICWITIDLLDRATFHFKNRAVVGLFFFFYFLMQQKLRMPFLYQILFSVQCIVTVYLLGLVWKK